MGDYWQRLLIAVLAVLLSACAGFVGSVTGEGEARDIRDIGVAARATVLDIWDTGIRINDDLVVGFRLEVWPAGGDTYEVETRAVVPILFVPQIQPGAVVPVKVDPADPQRVALDMFAERAGQL